MATLIAVTTSREGHNDDLRSYVDQAVPMLLGAGGQVVKRLAVTDVVAGGSKAANVLVMDFPDAQTVRAVFDSDGYKALIPVRDRAFEHIDILITEDL
ncbi:MAG: DUF1330 domain-containing protein [Acidimicrobiales bacterium]